MLRGIESRSRNGGGPGIRPAKSDLRSERVEEVLRLRRQDVERVGDNELRPLQLRQEPLQRIRQPRGIEVVLGFLLIVSEPPRESLGVLVPGAGADAPQVGEVPGVAALGGRAFDGKEAAPADDLLPELLLLRRREKHRQLGREVRIEAVLVEPLHESTERQDIRRFPDRKCFPDLESIELQHQRLRQALVGGDDGDARGAAQRNALEQGVLLDDRQLGARAHGRLL